MPRRFTLSLLVLCLVVVSTRPAAAELLLDEEWMAQATPATVQALLDRGAALMARAQFGETPLHVAARFNAPPVVALLLDRGPIPNSAIKTASCPLITLTGTTNSRVQPCTGSCMKSGIEAGPVQGGSLTHGSYQTQTAGHDFEPGDWTPSSCPRCTSVPYPPRTSGGGPG